MEHQEFEPPAELRGCVKCFWHLKRAFGALPARFEVVPDGYAELIFYVGGPCSLVTPTGLEALSSPFLVGLLRQPAVFEAQDELEIVAVRCFPWTVFELLGLPAGNDGVLDAAHPIARLQGVLAARLRAGQVAGAVAQLAAYCREVRAGVVPDSRLARAGGAMLAAHGTLPVSEVAAAAHATVRTLERNFKQAAGHTVKDVSGLMRFEQVRNRLWHEPDTNLAGLAQELGYTDQAHLSREFKRYSGTTPAAFARRGRRGR